jgi:hypothetical protein
MRLVSRGLFSLCLFLRVAWRVFLFDTFCKLIDSTERPHLAVLSLSWPSHFYPARYCGRCNSPAFSRTMPGLKFSLCEDQLQFHALSVQF